MTVRTHALMNPRVKQILGRAGRSLKDLPPGDDVCGNWSTELTTPSPITHRILHCGVDRPPRPQTRWPGATARGWRQSVKALPARAGSRLVTPSGRPIPPTADQSGNRSQSALRARLVRRSAAGRQLERVGSVATADDGDVVGHCVRQRRNRRLTRTVCDTPTRLGGASMSAAGLGLGASVGDRMPR